MEENIEAVLQIQIKSNQQPGGTDGTGNAFGSNLLLLNYWDLDIYSHIQQREEVGGEDITPSVGCGVIMRLFTA